MPFFIRSIPRYTFSTYLVEAESIHDVDKVDGEYLGVVDVDINERDPVAESTVRGPFETKEEALKDDSAYTEW